jgi:excisionase family DNA binding protein
MIPLPDGRWLALDEKSFREGVLLGRSTVLGDYPGRDTDTGERWLTAKEMAAEPTQWLSVDEVATRSGLKKSWLYQEIRANRLPHRHFGRQVRIPGSYLVEPVTKSGANGQGGQ